MAVYGEGRAQPRGSSSLKSKSRRREILRSRAPQAGDVGSPLDPDTDSESENEPDDINDSDDSDGDSDDDDPGRVNPPQSNLPGSQPTAPGFVTLVPPGSPTRISQPPAPPASEITGGPRSTLRPPEEETSATNVASQPVAPPESIVNSLPEFEPTTLVSSTITRNPGTPSETSASPIDEDAESFITDTSLLASTTAEATSIPTEDVEQVGSSDGGSKLNRGADVGIIIGTMALAAMIIAGCVLWYRRRTMRKANDDHLARLGEKPLPLAPGGDSGAGVTRTQFSSWANFIRPSGEDSGTQGAAGYYAEGGKGAQPVSPLSPAAPPAAHGTAAAFRSLTGQEPPSQPPSQPPPQPPSRYGGGPVEGRLVPPPTHLAPPPRTDIYPPGQVPINQYRAQSMAQTEITDSTEGTWRTWGVDQNRPKGKPR